MISDALSWCFVAWTVVIVQLTMFLCLWYRSAGAEWQWEFEGCPSHQDGGASGEWSQDRRYDGHLNTVVAYRQLERTTKLVAQCWSSWILEYAMRLVTRFLYIQTDWTECVNGAWEVQAWNCLQHYVQQAEFGIRSIQVSLVSTCQFCWNVVFVHSETGSLIKTGVT